MPYNRLVFRVHAIQHMFQRQINAEDVRHVLATGEILESYPDDSPYPSFLVLGLCGSRTIHVVVADNHDLQETIVITAYEPDPVRWEPNFRRRRTS